MAKIDIQDDEENSLIIDKINDRMLVSLINISRLAAHYTITPQLVALRTCKTFIDGEEKPYRSLVRRLTRQLENRVKRLND